VLTPHGKVIRRLLRVNDRIGRPIPVIVAPEELLGGRKEKKEMCGRTKLL
jgi:hypothetical protein